MKILVDIFYVIFIAFFVYYIIKDWLKLLAFASTSDAQWIAWIRYLHKLKAREKALDYIVTYTRWGVGENAHQVRDIMFYHLQLDSAWLTNYIEWGWADCEATLADTLDRIKEFVREWTDENPYLYSSQLEQIWKVHKGEYMSRGGVHPNVPKQLRPQQSQ